MAAGQPTNQERGRPRLVADKELIANRKMSCTRRARQPAQGPACFVSSPLFMQLRNQNSA